MPVRNWWEVTTPTQRRALVARNWRRQADATVFRARNDTNTKGELSDLLNSRLRAQQRNPLAPGPQSGASLNERIIKTRGQPLPKGPEAPTQGVLGRPTGYRGTVREPREGGTALGNALARVGGVAARAAGDTFSQVVSGKEFFGQGIERLTAGQVPRERVVEAYEALPGPLPRVADVATAPATLAGAGVRGLSFAPNSSFGVRLAAETAGEIGAEEAASRVPGPLKPVVGIAAGAAAGLGTAGALRGAGAGIRRAGIASPQEIVAAARRPSPLRPGEAFARAEIVPGSEDAWNSARESIKNALRRQLQRRQSGETGAEIATNRASQFGSVRQGLEEAQRRGMTETEASRFARGGTRGRVLSEAPGPLPISEQAREEAMRRLNSSLRTSAIDDGTYLNRSTSFDELLQGRRQLQPNEINSLAEFIDDPELMALLRQRNAGLRPHATGTGFRPRRTNLPGDDVRLPRAGEQVNVRPRTGLAAAQRREQQAIAAQFERDAAQRVSQQLPTREFPRPSLARTAGNDVPANERAVISGAQLEPNLARRGGVGQQQVRAGAQQASARQQADIAAQRAFEAGQLKPRDVERLRSNAPGIGNVTNETIPPAAVTEPQLRRSSAAAQRAHQRAQELMRQGERQKAQFRRARAQEIAATNVMNRERIEAAQVASEWSRTAKPRTVADRIRFYRAQEARSAIDSAVGRSDDEFIAAVRQLSGAEGMTLTDAQVEAIDLWLKGNRALLDVHGPEGATYLARIAAAVQGNFADPFLNGALQRRTVLASVLRSQGMDEKQVRTITRNLFNNELRVHYRGEVPQEVLQALRRDVNARGMFRAVDMVNQGAKNLMFSTDVGIVGQQGAAAVRYGGWQGLIGFVNRKLAGLGHPLVNLVDADSLLTRQQRYMLDGLHYGVGPSAVQNAAGIPVIGRTIDALNELQFVSFLGRVREAIYEGELVIARAVGLDISNPAVRARLADNANHITSFAHEATRGNRAGAERVALLSPSMTRSQIARFNDIAKFLSPSATADQRLSAAMMILSYATNRALLGAGLNAAVGIGDFEWDPSKPGSGAITLPNGVVINLFSQESFNSAVARSVRAIAEGDERELREAWGRFMLGRTSLAGNVVGSAVGWGYEPGSGFRFGDLTDRGRLENIMPVPPLVSSIIAEGYDTSDPATLMMLGFESAGIQSFRESPSTEERRIIEEQRPGVPYESIPRSERDRILQESGNYERIDQRRREDIEQQADRGDPQGRALSLTYEQRDRLNELSRLVGEDRVAYREQSTPIRDEIRARRNEYEDVFAGFSDPTAEQDVLIGRYWDLYDEATDRTTGLLDSDRLGELTLAFRTEIGDAKFRELIEAIREPDPLDNPLEQERNAVLLGLELSGYWDLRERAWSQLHERLDALDRPEAQFSTYDDYRDSWIADRTAELAPLLGNSARVTAERQFNSSEVKQVLDEYIGIIREDWVEQNRDIAALAISWGYLSPSVANIYSTTGVYTGSQQQRAPSLPSGGFGSGFGSGFGNGFRGGFGR